MKVKIAPQAHRVTMVIDAADIQAIQHVAAKVFRMRIIFKATHYVVRQAETEVLVPFLEPVIYEELTQDIPFQLYALLIETIENPALMPSLNAQLSSFSSLFVNSMEGFQLQITEISL
ncbi:hypothetical protein [Runella zeae]|uniref:hypothetical protein n=1 Tax=Runella zeae TaxID=94255 RepID=UPI00235369B1|nr:hypothetical protein [Runella zeae]